MNFQECLAWTVFALCVMAGCMEGGRIHHKERHRPTYMDMHPEVRWTDPQVCGNSTYPDAGEPDAQNQESKIYGGKEARPGEFPWTVELLNYGLHHCGAVLINHQWVLTAAHCVDGPIEFTKYNVTLGVHDKRDLDSPTRVSMEIELSDIHIHINYSSESGHRDDIALLKMPQAIAFTESIQPACPPNVTRDVAGHVCTVSGWGVTEGPSRYILRYANVPVVDHEQCSEWYNNNNVINEAMHLCAGYEDGGIDACLGDSGGPLACKFGDQFELHGIVSWGEQCALPKYPGVYTRVVSYLDWIQQVMDANP